jgi:hypothetical protein
LTIALPAWLGPLILLLVCSAAFWKGGPEERLTAAGLVVTVAMTMLLRDMSWPPLQRIGFAADIIMFLLLAGIALKTPKWWPLMAAGFELLSVLTHISKMVDRHVDQWAYITANVIWTYLLMIALGVGVWNSWRARQSSVANEQSSALQ